MMTTFGGRLSQLRNQRGLSQSELAKRFNISKSTLAMYEIDQREPNFEMLILIAEYFDVTMDYLILGK